MRKLSALAVLGLAGAFLLSGCAAELDPVEARDSLTEVTEDPEPPATASEYDAKLHPEPVVEPQECSHYLVITARGTGEPSKGQLLSPVAKDISKARPGEVTTEDLDYPADTNVKEGGTRGVRVLIDTLNVQAEACPDQEFVLLGYSQGAMVIGDTLAAADTRMIGETTGALNADAAAHVLAVVMYGDPRFEGKESFNVGSFDPELGGIMPRQLGSLDPYADRISDFCVEGDLVCQASLAAGESRDAVDSAQEQHVAYYTNGMQKEGAEFVIDKLGPKAKKTTPTR
ncbi:cutinase family protein [Leucobacter viscericola]|uniref:Cutinase family protein n=1 Tax=Leucobacter viscericola TaxID=2714935 RepID=A0A6G7XBZ9_9MICO|nr:cutinase family protein [Leucobacter viscericola]QIK61901.1 cutinase family protein [Leucobacter viscericola]